MNNELNNNLKHDYKLQILFLVILFLIPFSYSLYKYHIANSSKIKYTIIQFYELHTDSKTRGMKIRYYCNGEIINSFCSSKECANAIVGKRVLGYYYVNDPMLFGFLFEYVIPDSIQVPKSGWDKIPPNLKKSD